MMGGTMRMESEIGKGTTCHFSVTFALPKTLPEGEPSDNQSLENANVLVVDDNQTNRRLLEALLKRWGLKHQSVASGPAALDLISREAFDIVLLDVQMPEMDGFEVARKIRERLGESTVKIALLTSMGQRGDAAQCRELAIGAYLCKPLKISDLFTTIKALCSAGGSPQTRELITRHSLREGQSKLKPSARMRILVAEDNRVNQTLARRLLEKEGHTVTIANDGCEAITAFEKDCFDLILMDVQMPNMDGLAATKEIRWREVGNRRTPIIALTAHARTSDRDECIAAGMDGYVTKPIQVSQLWEAVAQSCGEPAADLDHALEERLG
jgi:CheY-like chemotaxis protein